MDGYIWGQPIKPCELRKFFRGASPLGFSSARPGYAPAVEVKTEDQVYHNSDGGRPVPVRIYHAVGRARAWVLFSVGYGGDRDGYAFLARAWAEIGISTVVTEHIGSNLAVLKSFPQKTREERNAEVVRRVVEPAELSLRPRDFHLVFQRLVAEFESLPLGLAGHSYGSYTALACCGLEPRQTAHGVGPLPAQAVLAISPQPPGLIFPGSEYAKVACPTLVLTGTRDDLLSGQQDYTDRLGVYEELPTAYRHLTVLEGVDHMAFAGIGLNLGDSLHLIRRTTSLWWSHTLFANAGTTDWAERLSAELPSKNGVTKCL